MSENPTTAPPAASIRPAAVIGHDGLQRCPWPANDAE
jgi:hypothetical protein